MKFVELGFALCAFAMGIFEFYQARKYLHTLKATGGPSTSSFALMAVWTSIIFSVIMIIGGCWLLVYMLGS